MSRLAVIVFVIFTTENLVLLGDICDRLDRIEKKEAVVPVCPSVDLDRACPGWWFHSDLIDARKRLCGRK